MSIEIEQKKQELVESFNALKAQYMIKSQAQDRINQIIPQLENNPLYLEIVSIEEMEFVNNLKIQ